MSRVMSDVNSVLGLQQCPDIAFTFTCSILTDVSVEIFKQFGDDRLKGTEII